MRKILATYVKDTYILEPLAVENWNETISIEKSKFTHKDNQQIWVVGLINNRIRVILLEIVKERTSVVLFAIFGKIMLIVDIHTMSIIMDMAILGKL